MRRWQADDHDVDDADDDDLGEVLRKLTVCDLYNYEELFRDCIEDPYNMHWLGTLFNACTYSDHITLLFMPFMNE